MGARRIAASAIGVAAWMTLSLPARAEPNTGATEARDPATSEVALTVAANDEEAAALERTLRELVGRLGLGLNAVRADASPCGAVRVDGEAAPHSEHDTAPCVWIDARGDERVVIDVYTAEGGAPVRWPERVVDRDGSSALVVEEVAHVVYATLESALVTVPPGAPAPPTPAPSYPPPSRAPEAINHRPPPPSFEVGLAALAFASAASVSTRTGLVTGAGAGVDVALGVGPVRPSAWLSLAFDSPFDAPGSMVTLETRMTSLRAIPTMPLVRQPGIDIELGAGGGIDVFRAVPRDAHGNFVRIDPTQPRGDLVVAGLLLGAIRIAPNARAIIALDLAWDPSAKGYDAIDRMGQSTLLFRPQRMRPSAWLGLCVPFFGGGPCAQER